ncbi:hypothetical protein BDV95DRAFT_444622, partial [Massariosphaeria phaeospora]
LDTGTLKDQNVIVTGGANGIGAGIVTAFAEAGAYVSILDINEEMGTALANRLSEIGHHVQFTRADMASFTSQTTAFRSAIAFSPNKTIDIVVANAGVPGNGILPWLDNGSPSADPEPPSTVALDVNLTGIFYTAHLAVHYFRQTVSAGSSASSKQLILVSSLAAYIEIPNTLDYTASKFGVRGIWRSLRNSVSILGHYKPPLRTNLIAPTFIRTAMTTQIESSVLGSGGKLGEVEDVVAGVLRVATDEGISGRALAVAKGEDRAGDRNFDLGDDFEGGGGGVEVPRRMRD